MHQLNIADGKVVHVFGGYSNAGIALSADGSLLAAAGQDKISLWTVGDHKLIRTIKAPSVTFLWGPYEMEWPYLTGVALSPDGKLVAACSFDHTASIWNVVTGEDVATLVDLKPNGIPPLGFFTVRFSPRGDTLTLGGSDAVGVWNAKDQELLKSAKTHSASIERIAASPDGTLLASVGWSTDVQLRSLPNGQTMPLTDQVNGIWSAAFSTDGKHLALGDREGHAGIWPLDDLAHPQTFEAVKKGPVTSIAFSPDGKALAFSAGGSIQVQTIADGAIRSTMTGSGRGYVTDMTYSPLGDLLASAAPDRISVFRTADASRLYMFTNGQSVAFSSDGSRLAGAATDQSVHVWDMSSGKEIFKTEAVSGQVSPVAFSADGSLLAGGDDKGTLYIWSAEDGSFLKSWAGHTSYG